MQEVWADGWASTFVEENCGPSPSMERIIVTPNADPNSSRYPIRDTSETANIQLYSKGLKLESAGERLASPGRPYGDRQ
jgi:hypothetical protein